MRRPALAIVALALSACAGPPAPDAAGTFVPERFFEGASVSRGEISTLLVFHETFTADFRGIPDPPGAVDVPATADVSGRAAPSGLVLDERFHFSDGDRLQRWRLRAVAGGRYAGTVETEDGEGRLAAPVPVSGYRTARGLVLDYEGFAPGGGALRLRFRHVMEAQGDGSVRNLVRISKFGVPIAGADVVFSKPAAPGS